MRKICTLMIVIGLLMISCQSKRQVEELTTSDYIMLSSTTSNINTQLSEAETAQIKLLAKTIALSKYTSLRYITDEDTVLGSVEEQALFLFNLNTMSDEDMVKKTFGEIADFTEDGMRLGEDSAKKIIQAAKGEAVGSELWDYISKENEAKASVIYVKKAGNEFVFPIFAKNSLEDWREYKNWEFVKEGNGNLRIKFCEYLEPEDIHVHDLELELYKNNESIFAGYSARKFIRKLALPDDMKNNLKPTEFNYTDPDILSKDMKDYTFSLEGKNYCLPAPVKAFTDKGWQLNLTSIPEKGDRKAAEFVKENKKISVVLCNYEGKEEENLYVIWLKVDNYEGKERINFELSGGIKDGDKKIEDKEYYFFDALYNDEFGTDINFDSDDLVSGFEMSYAPAPVSRIERINILSNSKSNKEIRLQEDIKDVKIEEGTTYLIPTSSSDIIKFEIKYLDKVVWGKYTVCLIKNGQEAGIYNSTYGRYIEQPEITLNKDSRGKIYVSIYGCDSRNNEKEEKVYIEGE